jgi:hypothetical protein
VSKIELRMHPRPDIAGAPLKRAESRRTIFQTARIDTAALAFAGILAFAGMGGWLGGVIEADGGAGAADGALEGLRLRTRSGGGRSAKVAAHQEAREGGGGQKDGGLLALHDSILSINLISISPAPTRERCGLEDRHNSKQNSSPAILLSIMAPAG